MGGIHPTHRHFCDIRRRATVERPPLFLCRRPFLSLFLCPIANLYS